MSTTSKISVLTTFDWKEVLHRNTQLKAKKKSNLIEKIFMANTYFPNIVISLYIRIGYIFATMAAVHYEYRSSSHIRSTMPSRTTRIPSNTRILYQFSWKNKQSPRYIKRYYQVTWQCIQCAYSATRFSNLFHFVRRCSAFRLSTPWIRRALNAIMNCFRSIL